jgi:hypothetical protein
MKQARIAQRNRFPDSIPVVLGLLEAHPEGVTIGDLQAQIEAEGLWDVGKHPHPRALYFRIYSVLTLLKSHGIVHTAPSSGRGDLWILDREEFKRQQRLELSELIQPFVDGCLMVTNPRQFVDQLNELVEDGTIETMLRERRTKGRRPK